MNDIPFSLQETRPGPFGQWLLNLLMRGIVPRLFGFLRTVAPVFRVPFTNVTLVTRFDDVQEIASRQNDFPVPYQRMVDQLDWVPTFLLAMKDTPEYHQTLKEVHALWRHDDLPFVREIAREASEKALDAAGGRIDAIQDLMVPVTLAVIERYYGIPVPKEDLVPFRDGSMWIAGYLFGPQSLDAKKIATAKRAIGGVWRVIDRAIAAARANPLPENTIIGRCHAQNITDDAHLRSYLMGMIVGYLPTNTNANGRIMDVVLNEPDALDAALAAAGAVDYDAMLRVVHESLRMNYILPGLWRTTPEPRDIGVGTRRLRRIDANRLIYISFMAAMMDPRRIPDPKRFDPTRSKDVYMVYGYRFHFCVGWAISDAMMKEIFMAIMKRRPRQVGRLVMNGNFPWNLVLDYAR
jgi:cytochrome P450